MCCYQTQKGIVQTSVKISSCKLITSGLSRPSGNLWDLVWTFERLGNQKRSRKVFIVFLMEVTKTHQIQSHHLLLVVVLEVALTTLPPGLILHLKVKFIKQTLNPKPISFFLFPRAVYFDGPLISSFKFLMNPKIKFQLKLDVETHSHISRLIQLQWKSTVMIHLMEDQHAMSNALIKNSNQHKKLWNASHARERENSHRKKLTSDVQFQQNKMVWPQFELSLTLKWP